MGGDGHAWRGVGTLMLGACVGRGIHVHVHVCVPKLVMYRCGTCGFVHLAGIHTCEHSQGAEAEGGGGPASPALADSQATLSPGQASLPGVTSSPSPCCGIKQRDKAFQPQSPMMRTRREGWGSIRRGAHHPGPLCPFCITK